ncbi:MAG: AbrB/MazE/SpoVT family DNA-binding domain-containing protein [Gemmatimonadales bacterium]
MRTRIAKWGNSLGLRIPKVFTSDAGLSAGDEVELTIEGGRILITPVGRDYRLGELVDRITADNRHDETDWGRPVGTETW